MSEIAVEALARRLAAGEPTYLLDVREPWEQATAVIGGSVLIPLGELPSRVHEVSPPADGLIVTICHHGVRSLSAAAFLREAGFTDVASLAGGIDAWSTRVDPGVPRY